MQAHEIHLTAEVLGMSPILSQLRLRAKVEFEFRLCGSARTAQLMTAHPAYQQELQQDSCWVAAAVLLLLL